MFRSKFSEDIFKHKYAHYGCETWDALASVLVEDVCQERLSTEDKDQLTRYVNDLKFIPRWPLPVLCWPSKQVLQ
jgi:ribonucleoside-diphosphate reductase alpha chain